MMRRHSTCTDIEPDLIATATGDADATSVARVEAHVARCAHCHGELRAYRAVGGVVDEWREAPVTGAAVGRSRDRLETALDDLRRRFVTYRVFPSPLGNILIARSDRGVSLVEYLGRAHDPAHSRLVRLGMEPQEDGAELESFYRELIDYLEGRRTRLEWPLDWRLVRSDFHREVLRITAGIPYGGTMSYAGVACEVGKPTATRAVAQALRWNPLPIVVPCHRVIGATGALTGYAGDKIGLKERLLATEGVHVQKGERDARVPRGTMYVRTPDGAYYCRPTCDWLSSFEHPNRLVLVCRKGAVAAGLQPCDECRPDLHPLPE